jgi:hypothetical protein
MPSTRPPRWLPGAGCRDAADLADGGNPGWRVRREDAAEAGRRARRSATGALSLESRPERRSLYNARTRRGATTRVAAVGCVRSAADNQGARRAAYSAHLAEGRIGLASRRHVRPEALETLIHLIFPVQFRQLISITRLNAGAIGGRWPQMGRPPGPSSTEENEHAD